MPSSFIILFLFFYGTMNVLGISLFYELFKFHEQWNKYLWNVCAYHGISTDIYDVLLFISHSIYILILSPIVGALFMLYFIIVIITCPIWLFVLELRKKNPPSPEIYVNEPVTENITVIDNMNEPVYGNITVNDDMNEPVYTNDDIV